MSTDYAVFAGSSPSTEQLSAALMPLGVVVAAEGDAGWLLTHEDATVWVNAPEWVEPEELPDVLGADRPMARLDVASTSTTRPETGDAMVRALVAALDRGVLVDSDGEVVGPRQPDRKPAKVSPGADPGDRLIALNWYGRVRPGSDPAGALWDAATRTLPWAVPRKVKQRRGPAIAASREVLQKQWEDTEEDTLVFSASSATHQGSLTTRQQALRNSQGMWRLGFLFPGGFLQESAVEQLNAFFAEVAETSGADYASAEVQSDVLWHRGEVSTRADSKAAGLQIVFDPLGRDGLWGLPPKPVWWSWFGADYQQLAGAWLARPRRGWRLTKMGQGALLSLGDGPLTAAELRSAGHGTSGWIPDELVVRQRLLRGGLLPARRRLGPWEGEDGRH